MMGFAPSVRRLWLFFWVLLAFCACCSASADHDVNLEKHKQMEAAQCRDVVHADDKCDFVKQFCDESASVPYLRIYYCTFSHASKFGFLLLVLWIIELFSTVGIAASDFFCPNLSTMANTLKLSESVSGVTLLAFGNGSPDVFSTIAAVNSNSAALAIGELLGSAMFIVAIVAGSMALIRPFRIARKSFLRDIAFFTGAVCLTMIILADGNVNIWQGLVMILYYVAYVLFVVFGTWFWNTQERRRLLDSRARDTIADTNDYNSRWETRNEVHDAIGLAGEEVADGTDIRHLEGQEEEMGPEEQQQLQSNFATIERNMSVVRPGHSTFQQGRIRPSLLGALESFKDDSVVFRDRLGRMQVTPSGSSSPARSPYSSTNNIQQDSKLKVSSHQRIDLLNSRSYSTATIQDGPFGANEHSTDGPRSAIPVFTEEEDHQAADTDRPQRRRMSADMGVSNGVSINGLEGQQINPWEVSLGKDFVSQTAQSTNAQDSREGSPASEIDVARQPRRPTLKIPVPDDETRQPTERDARELSSWKEWIYLLFPTLARIATQRPHQKVFSVLAAPSVLVFRLTLPVVEQDCTNVKEHLLHNQANLQQEQVAPFEEQLGYPTAVDTHQHDCSSDNSWNRQLIMIQCIASPLAITFLNVSSIKGSLKLFLLSGVIGLLMLAFVLAFSTKSRPPRGRFVFCLIGFAVSISWISTIANEVVGSLHAIGAITGISDAILGLTVFAAGNSIADLVADITIARMGFSQMALGGVFGGPMLNILIGIGVSGLLSRVSRKHKHKKKGPKDGFNVKVNPTLIVGAVSLLFALVFLMLAVPMNKYGFDRKIGVALITIFVIATTVNLIVESKTGFM